MIDVWAVCRECRDRKGAQVGQAHRETPEQRESPETVDHVEDQDYQYV